MDSVNTTPKPFVFVLMPFSTEFDDIYQLGIKGACTECGAYCERVDEQIFEGSILERIYNQIAKADVVVADLTGKNANVFYETGYAHAIGKRVVLLTQREEDIPFDLRHYSHVIYKGKITELRDELVRRITHMLAAPQASFDRLPLLQFYYKGLPLKGLNIEVEVSPSQYSVQLRIDAYNPSSHVTSLARLALVTTDGLDLPGGGGLGILLPDGRHLLRLADVPVLYPEVWHSIDFGFLRASTGNVRTRFGDSQTYFSGTVSAYLRVYEELGPRDVPFSITINETSSTEPEVDSTGAF